MRRYWWVNHNDTGVEEVGGEYLWSPKREHRTNGKGARSQFYDNMALSKPGDFVLSYYDKRVRHVGRIAEHAFTAPKPLEYGKKGEGWSAEGWRVPLTWEPVNPPVWPKPIYDELRPLLREKHNPLNRNGDGAQKAYFSEITQGLFERILRETNVRLDRLETADVSHLAFNVVKDAIDDELVAEIENDPSLSSTEKQRLVTARRGQGIFRQKVLKLGAVCRITGVSNPWMLIASHIKPWRSCENSNERLDGANGIMLTPDLDLLFDHGFISFEDDGRVIVSKRIEDELLDRLKLADLKGMDTGPFTQEQVVYLTWHREKQLLL